jgi:hypothetical protein
MNSVDVLYDCPHDLGRFYVRFLAATLYLCIISFCAKPLATAAFLCRRKEEGRR